MEKKLNILAHASFIGKTGYANHAKSFFCALNKYANVKVRNLTVGDSWCGLSEKPHENKIIFQKNLLGIPLIPKHYKLCDIHHSYHKNMGY